MSRKLNGIKAFSFLKIAYYLRNVCSSRLPGDSRWCKTGKYIGISELNVYNEGFKEAASVRGNADGNRDVKLTVGCRQGSSNHSTVLKNLIF